MRRNTRNFHLVALALILSLAGVALAQENPTGELVALSRPLTLATCLTDRS